MTATPPTRLSLAHSPDPDDVFMWWPLTGKIDAQAWSRRWATAPAAASAEPNLAPAAIASPPILNTGRFAFDSIPADIEALNKRAIAHADLDITALSFRAYADVQHRYILTACGSSFGDGYGPKVVARPNDDPAPLRIHDSIEIHCEGCLRPPDVHIAVPGTKTTAFMLLGLVLGPKAMLQRARFIEMPFEQIIPAVIRGEHQGHPIHAGLVIHEGQVTFQAAGLRLVVDVGSWWKSKTGLPLPLGANAIRRDLDTRFGPSSLHDVAALLRHSVRESLARRAESLAYTLPFALANVTRSGMQKNTTPTDATPHGGVTTERVDSYINMYVNRWTQDMGPEGVEALRRLYAEGAAASLCPPVSDLTVI
jgi:1,4-dihydroxy-6-naphthoate synthase